MKSGNIVLRVFVRQIQDVLKRRLRINKKDIEQVIEELKIYDRDNHLNWENVKVAKEAESYGYRKQE